MKTHSFRFDCSVPVPVPAGCAVVGIVDFLVVLQPVLWSGNKLSAGMIIGADFWNLRETKLFTGDLVIPIQHL